MEIKPRIGIYGSVPRNSEFFGILSGLLGYDPFSVREVRQDAVIAPVCGRAKTFGTHFTIYDIFTPTDYGALITRLKELLAGINSFEFHFTKFSGYVRGDYQGKSVYNDNLKTVLALDFDDESVKKIKALHKLIVENIQDLRAKIEPEFDKEIFRNNSELWPVIQKYGAPYVLHNYSPHLSVATKLSGDEGQFAGLVEYLDKNYRDKLIVKPIPFDGVYIFEEIIGGEFNGYFKVREKLEIK
jgi:hypothetical protein